MDGRWMAVLELDTQEQRIKPVSGEVSIKRDKHGTPVIKAEDFPDALYGLGMVHAFDRGMQMELTRLVARGRMAEHLPPTMTSRHGQTMRKYESGLLVQAEKILEEGARRR